MQNENSRMWEVNEDSQMCVPRGACKVATHTLMIGGYSSLRVEGSCQNDDSLPKRRQMGNEERKEGWRRGKEGREGMGGGEKRGEERREEGMRGEP